MAETQEDLGNELLALFHADGEAEDVILLDLLDNLATVGMKLVRLQPDEENVASREYMALLPVLPRTRPG